MALFLKMLYGVVSQTVLSLEFLLNVLALKPNVDFTEVNDQQCFCL